MASVRAVFMTIGKILCVLLISAFFLGMKISPPPEDSLEQQLLQDIEELQNIPYRFEIREDIIKTLSPEDLGIFYDAKRTIQKLRDAKNPVVKFFSNTQVKVTRPVVLVNEEILHDALQNILSSFEFPSVNAEMVWEKGFWTLKPSIPGRILKERERERIFSEIQQSLFRKEFAHRTSVFYEGIDATHHEDSFRDFLAVLKETTEVPIEIQVDGKKEFLRLADFPDSVAIDLTEHTLSVQKDFILSFVSDFQNRHNTEGGQVIVESLENVVSEYDKKTFQRAIVTGDFYQGKKIDEGSLLDQLLLVPFKKDQDRVVKVPFQTLPPRIVSKVDGVQFQSLLSIGRTSYKLGNYPARVKNIGLSLEALKGVIIAPQEEFSFNRVTGWVHGGKGYTKTKIIVDGRVEEGVGGGVCQTSTTLFRAMLNAGLPFTERKPHSLDVAYYHAYGHGLDASVFTEARQDLRFVNDLETPILIHAYLDDEKDEAIVEFFGTSDGRKVVLENIPTGYFLHKKWSWKIIWPDKQDLRFVESRYILPRQERQKPLNPLEA